jgi:hypothetical protein
MMPWTLAMLRSRVRRELGDTEAVRLWSDEAVADHLADAIRELSHALPRDPVSIALTTVAGQRDYALGVDVVQIVAVELPLGTMVPEARAPLPAGDSPAPPSGGYAQAWTATTRPATVRLRNAPATSGASFRVHYIPMIALPAGDGEAIAVAEDEGALLALLACRSLWELRRLADAKRGLRTPGAANPFAARVEAMLRRRTRRARGGVMRDEQ